MIKQAIIPLAGLGTRLLPLTSVFAKELLPINGKPGIEYILDECIDAGITEIIFIISKKKDFIQKKLREKRIETNQVHFRNDKYSIFKKFVKGKKYPNMDYVENKYLAIPVHHKVSFSKAKYIADLINKIV